MDVKINVEKRFIVNGKEYHSLDEMPADIRQLYETAVSNKGTAALHVGDVSLSGKINFNGKIYSTPEEMPPEARELYEKAIAMAKRGGSEVITSKKYGSVSSSPIEPTSSTKAARFFWLAGAAVLLLFLLYLILHMIPKR